MYFPIEIVVAFPSRCLSLDENCATFFGSVDGERPWASAVAVRPVQQQHQTQVPFWPQLHETEFWPQTGQPQQWSTPRSPLGLTGPPSAATNMGCKHSWFWLWRRRSTGCLVDWLECERKRMQGLCHAIHGILESWPDTEVGLPETRNTIETLVARVQFLATRHQCSCEQTRCLIVQGVTPWNDWSEFGRSIFGGSNLFGSRIWSDHRCNSSSFSIVSGGRTRGTGGNSLPIDEVSKRIFCGIHVANQQQTSSAFHAENKARDYSTERVTGAELRKRTRCYRCRQLGHNGERVSESSTEGHSSIFSQEFLFCQEMFFHSCTICRLTCCMMVHPRLLWGAILIWSILSSLAWFWDQLVVWWTLEHSNLWWTPQLLCDGAIDFSSGTVWWWHRPTWLRPVVELVL